MKYMGLCEKQKAIILLGGLIIVIVIGVVFHQTILTIIGVLGLLVDLVGLLSKWFEKREITKEKRLMKLNDSVFKRWVNIKKRETPFQIEILIDENIDTVLLEDAINFLNSKKKKYGIILELRSKIKYILAWLIVLVLGFIGLWIVESLW